MPFDIAFCALRACTALALGFVSGQAEHVHEAVAAGLEAAVNGGEALTAFSEREQQVLLPTLRKAAKHLEELYAQSLRQSHSAGFRENVETAFANFPEVFARCLPSAEALAELNHDPDKVAKAVVVKAIAIQMEVFKDPHGEAHKLLTALIATTYRELREAPEFVETLAGVNWAVALGRLDRMEGEIKRQAGEAERRHRELLAANEAILASNEAIRLELARDRGVDPELLRPLFEHLGMAGLTTSHLRARAREAVAAMLARANEAPAPSNFGPEIDAIIAAARARLKQLDTAGAETILDGQIAEEEAAFRRRQIPLLTEKAAVQRLSYNHDGARATLRRVLALDADNAWAWVALGDIARRLGSTTEALAAYRAAEAADSRAGDERHLSVSYDRIGNVLVRQGTLPEALKSYRAGLEISERLAGADPGNSDWQRDLSVSYDRIGDVLVRQGTLPEALKSYRAGLEIRERLAGADPGNSDWQRDLIVSCVKIAEAAPEDAEAMLTRAWEIVTKLRGEGRLAPVDAWMPAEIERRLAEARNGRA